MEDKTLKRHPETPEKLTGFKKEKPKVSAAGVPALISSTKHILEETGLGRGLKALNNLNQHEGTDCPGCAWPDPDDERSRLGEYCENGAKAIAEEATTKKLIPQFFKNNSVSELSKLSDYEIGKKGRIAQPMFLPAGKDNYEEITWDEAFQKIGGHLNALASPDEAIFYTSGRTSNEAAFLYQLFVREYGTNNLPDCSNMCHESSGKALGATLGIGKGSVKLEDFYESELIIIMGQNPGTNHPRMLSALQKAKRNGAKIITVNPIVETGLLNFKHPQEVKSFIGGKTKLTDLYLQVKINGDQALLQIVIKRLLELQNQNKSSFIIDEEFIESKTNGFDEYIEHIKNINEKELIEACQISEEDIQKMVKLLANKNKIIVCWAMGLTQHKNSVNTIKEVVNLLLLKGSIGKPGAGTCPVRGHSNVQGDRTMGIHEAPSSKLLDSIAREFKFEPPREHGYDTVEAIKAMYEGKAKVFFGMGGNFISATPDTYYTAQALQNCNLTVHVSTKLNRSHLIHGKEAIILPCLARTDVDITNEVNQFVTVENSMGVVHTSIGNLKPVSDKLLSEIEIVCRMANSTLENTKLNWSDYSQNYDLIRDAIEATIPGFDDYNKRVRIKGGFYLPNCARDNQYNTASGKGEFTASIFKAVQIENDEFIMMTIRSHDQFNTTIYGLDDRYRGIKNERRIILMNADDMKEHGLKENDLVDLINNFDGVERIAKKFIVVSYNIPHQCTATYFPEANILVPINSTADKSNTPTSKSVVIRMRKH